MCKISVWLEDCLWAVLLFSQIHLLSCPRITPSKSPCLCLYVAGAVFPLCLGFRLFCLTPVFQEAAEMSTHFWSFLWPVTFKSPVSTSQSLPNLSGCSRSSLLSSTLIILTCCNYLFTCLPPWLGNHFSCLHWFLFQRLGECLDQSRHLMPQKALPILSPTSSDINIIVSAYLLPSFS